MADYGNVSNQQSYRSYIGNTLKNFGREIGDTMTDIRMKFSLEEYPNMHQNGSGFYQKEEGIPLNKEELDFFSKEKEEPSIIDKVIESINDFFAPAEEITEEIPTEIEEVEENGQLADKDSVQRYV